MNDAGDSGNESDQYVDKKLNLHDRNPEADARQLATADGVNRTSEHGKANQQGDQDRYDKKSDRRGRQAEQTAVRQTTAIKVGARQL